jgi:hypothetical protein
VLTGFGNKVALNADGSVMASQAEWNDPLTNTSKSERVRASYICMGSHDTEGVTSHGRN